MAITVIDPGVGSLAESIKGLLGAVANRVNEKQIREKQLMENPNVLAQLAPGYRAAKEAGAGEQYLIALGVNPATFGQHLDAFQPTVDEIQDKEIMKSGIIPAQILAQLSTAQATTAQNEANLKNDVFNQTAFASVQKAILEGKTAEEGLRQNLHILAPMAQAFGLRAESNRIQYEDELVKYRRENGIDITELDAKKAQAVLGQNMGRAYQQYFDSLPQGSHQRTVAAMALTNPAQLSHIQFHEGMDFQKEMYNLEQSAKTGAPQTVEDRVALTAKVREMWTSALDKAAEAMRDGTTEENKEFRQARVNDVNTTRLMIEDLAQAGAIFPIDTAEASMDGKNISLTPRIFQDNRLGSYAEELYRQGVKDFSEADAVAKEHLDARSYEQLKALWPAFAQSKSPRTDTPATSPMSILQKYNDLTTRLQQGLSGTSTTVGPAIGGLGNSILEQIIGPLIPKAPPR